MKMKRTTIRPVIGILALLAAVGGVALAAQDRYAVQVPGGLAFSEFRGYDNWQLVSLSQNGSLIATILGNPKMITALKAGIPANGKPFPRRRQDGKDPLEGRQEPGRGPAIRPYTGNLDDIDFMAKDSRRFADSGGLGIRGVRIRCLVR